jgi:hypothetical protein
MNMIVVAVTLTYGSSMRERKLRELLTCLLLRTFADDSLD